MQYSSQSLLVEVCMVELSLSSPDRRVPMSNCVFGYRSKVSIPSSNDDLALTDVITFIK